MVLVSNRYLGAMKNHGKYINKRGANMSHESDNVPGNSRHYPETIQVRKINLNNDPMIIGSDYDPPHDWGKRTDDPSPPDNDLPLW